MTDAEYSVVDAAVDDVVNVRFTAVNTAADGGRERVIVVAYKSLVKDFLTLLGGIENSGLTGAHVDTMKCQVGLEVVPVNAQHPDTGNNDMRAYKVTLFNGNGVIERYGRLADIVNMRDMLGAILDDSDGGPKRGSIVLFQ